MDYFWRLGAQRVGADEVNTVLFLLSIWCCVLLSIFVPCAWNAFLTLSAYVCFDIGVAGVVRDLFIYLCGNTTVLLSVCDGDNQIK